MANDNTVSVHIDGLFGALPEQRGQHWDLLARFFTAWLGELGPSDGYAPESIRATEERLQLRLPSALREWYALAGRRKAVWCCQDHFLAPEELRIEDDNLILCVEAQAVVKWGIPLSSLRQDDPPVFVSDQCDRRQWIEETPTVSVFALAQMLLDTKFCEATRYTANGQANDEALAAVVRRYQRLDFPDLHWPPHPTRLYGGCDLIIETDAETWFWVSARSPATFRSAIELIESQGAVWEQVLGL